MPEDWTNPAAAVVGKPRSEAGNRRHPRPLNDHTGCSAGLRNGRTNTEPRVKSHPSARFRCETDSDRELQLVEHQRPLRTVAGERGRITALQPLPHLTDQTDGLLLVHPSNSSLEQ